jgi:hypothetical protein
MVCHTCGGKGHFKHDYPNAKVMLLNRETNEYETEDDANPFDEKDDDPNDTLFCDPSTNPTLVCSQRALQVAPSPDEQRYNLFQPTVDVGNGKSCKFIIDGGSCHNLASKELCTKLKLKYYPHPNLYCISGLSDVGEMKITNTAHVDFSIGIYMDTVECDVVPMTLCHLLLGRPWQYDRDVRHNGKANTHQLHWKGKDIILRLMTPQAIVNESQQKMEVWLEQGEPCREPSLPMYEPFSASVATHFTACFAAAPVLAQACAGATDAPCALTTAMAPAAPAPTAALPR